MNIIKFKKIYCYLITVVCSFIVGIQECHWFLSIDFVSNSLPNSFIRSSSFLVESIGFTLFFFFFFHFYCYSITVVCLFSTSLHPIPAEPTSLSHLHSSPWFCPYVLYSSSCNPLSSLSPSHSHLTLARLFLTSMSLVIFCLLLSSVNYVPVKGEIIWAFVPHCLAYFT